MAARGAGRSNPAGTSGRNDRSTWGYNSERTFFRQALSRCRSLTARSHAPLRPLPRLRRPRNDRHARRRRPRSPRSASCASTPIPTAAARRAVSEWSTLVNPGDARSRRRSRRSPASPTRWCATRRRFAPHRRRGRRAHRRRALRRAQRALRLRLPQARVRAPRAARSRARVLCTVRLSRRLFPESRRHNLDSVDRAPRAPARRTAIARWATRACSGRSCRRSIAISPADAIEQAARRVLRTPSLPPQLAARRARRAARSAGRLSLLRPQRAAALHRQEHATCASASARISRPTTGRRPICGSRAEIRRIEFEETAGEIGALLREAALVKAMLPAHNHALRRKAESGVLELPDAPGPPRYRACRRRRARATSAGRFGPFSSRRAGARDAAQARRASTRCAGRRSDWRGASGPCFARQVKRCAGACVGAESAEAHHARARASRSRRSPIPPWPYAGPRGDSRASRCSAIASTCTCSATGAGSAPRATKASSRA